MHRNTLVKYLVLIESGGAMVARLYDAKRGHVSDIDASSEEVAVMTAGLQPRHAAEDAVAIAGSAPVIAGKFAYGMVSKDLEAEDVLVFLDDCTGWVALGRHTTDEEGRIAVPAPALPGRLQ